MLLPAVATSLRQPSAFSQRTRARIEALVKAAPHHRPVLDKTPPPANQQLSGKTLLAQTIVQTCEQRRNCFLVLIAHVGEAEGFSAQFPVAGINNQMMPFAQLSRERQHVDSFVVLYAGECF